MESEEEVYGPEGRDASKKANQQRMDLSKLIATKVALNYLGYPAEFTGNLGAASDLANLVFACEALRLGQAPGALGPGLHPARGQHSRHAQALLYRWLQ